MARVWTAIWEALFPYIPKCVGCGVEKDVSAYLCPDCTAQLKALESGVDNFYGLRTVAAYVYEGMAARVVRRFKYNGSRWLSAFMAEEMMRALAGQRIAFNCVCHVPLHSKKRRARGFDQAALLAQRISALTGKPYVAALRRVRHTPSQTKLSSAQRRDNVNGAFEALRRVQGHVLLVDDVLTTGATAEACAAALSVSGAQRVTVVTFAKAPSPEN